MIFYLINCSKGANNNINKPIQVEKESTELEKKVFSNSKSKKAKALKRAKDRVISFFTSNPNGISSPSYNTLYKEIGDIKKIVHKGLDYRNELSGDESTLLDEGVQSDSIGGLGFQTNILTVSGIAYKSELDADPKNETALENSRAQFIEDFFLEFLDLMERIIYKLENNENLSEKEQSLYDNYISTKKVEDFLNELKKDESSFYNSSASNEEQKSSYQALKSALEKAASIDVISIWKELFVITPLVMETAWGVPYMRGTNNAAGISWAAEVTKDQISFRQIANILASIMIEILDRSDEEEPAILGSMWPQEVPADIKNIIDKMESIIPDDSYLTEPFNNFIVSLGISLENNEENNEENNQQQPGVGA